MGEQKSRSHFQVHWVLVQELAIGPAPQTPEHLDQIAESGITAVLSLCSKEEQPPPEGLEQRFVCRRLVLPDHRSERLIEPHEVLSALDLLAELTVSGPVYVHCLAAMERSPLVCLGWLMRQRRLTLQRALDYLMQVHPGTSPLPEQLGVLRRLI
ncbi:MAG: dual specificity protein phosphatase [Anderseniella sp.]|jgi:predicted protein tyrosine phosphatase|nr:dual specificity protein phosphatase [Anderseniella sp.]